MNATNHKVVRVNAEEFELDNGQVILQKLAAKAMLGKEDDFLGTVESGVNK